MIMGAVSTAWLEAPLRRFVQDSRVQRAIVLRPDGSVLGQFGFQNAPEVMAACALAAAINASSSLLATQLGERPFVGLYQGGRTQGVFMGTFAVAGKSFLVLAAFDRESTLGLVRLYFGEFRAALAAFDGPGPLSDLPMDLEADLNSSLEALFGPLS